MKTTIVVLIFIVALPSAGNAGLRVVGTLPDFAALAEELGGDRVEAESLIRGTQDPHYVDAKPSLIVKVNQADLLVCIGMQLETGWLPVLLTQSRNGSVQKGARGYLDASWLIQPKEVPINPDRTMGDIHGGGNPHYYTSPDEMYKVAKGIHDKLIELDPEGLSYYKTRWKEFNGRYLVKIAEWKKRLAPLKGSKIVVYHLSWIYFIDWAGFERVDALEPKPGIPPSASHVTRLLARVRSLGVRQVWQEIYHPSRLSTIFARKAKARLVVLPSMVGAEAGIETITGKFDRMVELIVGE